MNEKTPEISRDIPRPPVEGGGEVQHAGPEFYNDAQRKWTTEGEKEASADKLKEIARIGETEPPAPKPDEKTETGLSPAEHADLIRDPHEWINSAISNKKLSAYEQMVGLTEATEAVEEQGKLDKAA